MKWKNYVVFLGVALVIAIEGNMLIRGTAWHSRADSDPKLALLAKLASADTIMAGIKDMPPSATLLYMMVPGDANYPELKRLWHFRIEKGVYGLDCETADSQFFEPKLQARLEELGIGYEKGMVGGYLAPDTSDPNEPRVPCRLWPNGKITTTMPGVSKPQLRI